MISGPGKLPTPMTDYYSSNRSSWAFPLRGERSDSSKQSQSQSPLCSIDNERNVVYVTRSSYVVSIHPVSVRIAFSSEEPLTFPLEMNLPDKFGIASGRWNLEESRIISCILETSGQDNSTVLPGSPNDTPYIASVKDPAAWLTVF